MYAKLEEAMSILKNIPRDCLNNKTFRRKWMNITSDGVEVEVVHYTAEDEVDRAIQSILEYIEEGYATPEQLEGHRKEIF